MKLSVQQSNIEEQLSEFDIWVTPSLGDIRDSDEFVTVLTDIQSGIEILSGITDRYQTVETCTPTFISNKLIDQIRLMSRTETSALLLKAISVLFMVTGKTDNNMKCQFPIYLRQQLSQEYLPNVTNGRMDRRAIPRTLESNRIASIIASLSGYLNEQQELLTIYLSFILSDEEYVKQLWSIGHSYVALKEHGAEKSLVSSLAVFKSRGSITAIQGHSPEQMLRERMSEWGLVADLDYNTQDITVGAILGETDVSSDIKRRKYDFILPYASRNNGEKIFVQCQFYAGDSGSVSHKNVDQTTGTRNATKKKYPAAYFVEYVDGAGYCSSLNGDLRRLLCMADTRDFFQIRTAPIKLRRDLQEISFLTLLEVEQAIITVGGSNTEITAFLLQQGYSEQEIQGCLDKSVEHGLLIANNDKSDYMIITERKGIVRRYCLLDSIAVYGHAIPADELTGNLLVPGYTVNWGLPQNQLITKLLEIMPTLRKEWVNMEDVFNDLQWLIDRKYIIAK
jgi:hypothetical protein